MPIKPGWSPFTLATKAVRLDRAAPRDPEPETFQRLEFSNERRWQVKNANGTKAIRVQGAAGFEYQLESACNDGDNPREIGPDDDNIDNIYRRWDIIRWELAGMPSTVADLEYINGIYRTHLALWANYQQHIKLAASADISIEMLDEMQEEDFSYLTTTGIHMNGFAIGSGTDVTLSNILIRSFAMEVDLEEELNYPHTSSRVLRSWSAVVEHRVNVPESQATFG